MARDLIPPPSPAGRPDPDAGKHQTFSESTLLRTDAEHEAALLAESAVEPAEGGSRYRPRFGFVLGALVGVGVAAMVVVALIVASDNELRQPPWSDWKPESDDPDVAAVEVAQYVGRRYRQDNGDQLVDVYAQKLEIGGTPLQVVIRSTGKGEGADIIDIPGKSLLFVLKGLGPNGSIDTGEASPKRLRLLQREAYELALYAFKYVDGVDSVVAFLPPPPPTAAERAAAEPDRASDPLGQSPFSGKLSAGELAASLNEGKGVNAMLFLPGDIASSLKRPLAETFPDPEPPRPSTLSDAEEETFGAFAQLHGFSASVVPDQTGAGFLVLDRAASSAAVQDALRAKLKA